MSRSAESSKDHNHSKYHCSFVKTEKYIIKLLLCWKQKLRVNKTKVNNSPWCKHIWRACRGMMGLWFDLEILGLLLSRWKCFFLTIYTYHLWTSLCVTKVSQSIEQVAHSLPEVYLCKATHHFLVHRRAACMDMFSLVGFYLLQKLFDNNCSFLVFEIFTEWLFVSSLIIICSARLLFIKLNLKHRPRGIIHLKNL